MITEQDVMQGEAIIRAYNMSDAERNYVLEMVAYGFPMDRALAATVEESDYRDEQRAQTELASGAW